MATELGRGWGHAHKTAVTIALAIFLLLAMMMQATALVDLTSPADNAHTNQTNMTFGYYVNFNATTCTLFIESSAQDSQTNLTEGFHELEGILADGPQGWKVVCIGTNGSDESIEHTVTLDKNPPSVVLFTPADGSTITIGNAEMSFVALDTYTSPIPCILNIDGEPAYGANATSSEPQTLIAPLEEGEHNWSVMCTDLAGNTKESDTRTFQVNITLVPEFGLVLSRTAFYTGEQGSVTVSAPYGSNARVEVCPDMNGFVECSVPIDVQNSSAFPIQENLPFLYYANRYVVEAYFTYANYTETKVASYNVTSNIGISISAPDNPRKNEPVILKATAGGGYGNLNYTWHLSDGRNINDDEANITYTATGSFTNTVEVNDAYGNAVNKSVTMEVSDSYHIRIIVKDQDTGSTIRKATVDIDDQEKETGTDGAVDMYLRQGKRDLTVLAENYSVYLEELNITQDQTFTVELARLVTGRTNPTVTLIAPDNGAQTSGSQTKLSYKVEHGYKTNCSVYISEETNSGFFIYLGSMDVAANDNSAKELDVIDLENMTYTWKVECVDDRQYKGSSPSWTFTPGQQSGQGGSDEGVSLINSRVKEYELLLSDINNMAPDLREGLAQVGVIKDMEDSIMTMKNSIRDIDGLRFKNLNAQDEAREKANLLMAAEDAYMRAPVNAQLLDSNTYVDYIEYAELEELARELISIRYEENASINLKRALEALEDLQQEVVISTKTRSIRLSYRDGSQKDIGTMTREIKTYNITKGAKLLEIIPKSIASSASEIKSTSEFEVIKDDPIIAFPLEGDRTITYYFEKGLDSDTMKGIRTAVFMELDGEDIGQMTGFSISDLKLPGLKSGLAIAAIIAVLAVVAAVGAARFGGVEAAKYTGYLVSRKNTLHYMNVILNDLGDNLEAGDLAKAVELYNEAKSAYMELPSVAKNDVYDRVVAAAERISQYQNAVSSDSGLQAISGLMKSADQRLGDRQINDALEEYKKIEELFHGLSDSDKEVVHSQLVNLGNRIQVMIASNKDLI